MGRGTARHAGYDGSWPLPASSSEYIPSRLQFSLAGPGAMVWLCRGSTVLGLGVPGLLLLLCGFLKLCSLPVMPQSGSQLTPRELHVSAISTCL